MDLGVLITGISYYLYKKYVLGASCRRHDLRTVPPRAGLEERELRSLEAKSSKRANYPFSDPIP
jgi:hypothetical protein